MNLLQRLKTMRERRGRPARLRHTDESIALLIRRADGTDSSVAELPWCDIVSAVAFKRDRWSVDLICIQFTDCEGVVVEVDEEMHGWDGLLQRLPAYLPGCVDKADILAAVMLPAFRANETVIFDAGRDAR